LESLGVDELLGDQGCGEDVQARRPMGEELVCSAGITESAPCRNAILKSMRRMKGGKVFKKVSSLKGQRLQDMDPGFYRKGSSCRGTSNFRGRPIFQRGNMSGERGGQKQGGVAVVYTASVRLGQMCGRLEENWFKDIRGTGCRLTVTRNR